MRPRLLLNENVPLPSAKLLRASGWDALAIADGYSSIDDATVMRLAREESRWLITSDRDYRHKGSYRQKGSTGKRGQVLLRAFVGSRLPTHAPASRRLDDSWSRRVVRAAVVCGKEVLSRASIRSGRRT